MKRLILAALAGTTIGAATLPKDRAAIMYYTGSDSVISLVPSADSANLAMILMTQWRGDSVPVARVVGRPCLGVALFSHIEWGKYLTTGRRAEDLKPKDASWRLRIYAPSGKEPITIQEVSTGMTYHAIGLDRDFIRKQALTSRNPGEILEVPLWSSVENRLGNLKGACDVK